MRKCEWVGYDQFFAGQGPLSRENLSIYAVHKSKQNFVKEKLVKENLVACTGLKTCPAVHTRKVKLVTQYWLAKKNNLFIVRTGASKATKELVKGNLVVCVQGLTLDTLVRVRY